MSDETMTASEQMTLAENLGAPWEFDGIRVFDREGSKIWEAGGVADGGGIERDYLDQDLDWESIVRAVNSHDDLLAALKAILARDDYSDGLCDGDGGAPGESNSYTSIELEAALNLARAAIAKAEGPLAAAPAHRDRPSG